jgi:hypothetical protein
MEGVARFKHKPLPDSTTHIRLLEIETFDTYDRISCLLTAWPLDKAPDYYALSYVLRNHARCMHCTNLNFLVSDTHGARNIKMIAYLSMDKFSS